MNDIELKNRSYANRVTPGAVVTFIAPNNTLVHTSGNTWDADLAAGKRLTTGGQYTATVRCETNAGFRGIEMSVIFPDGTSVSGISTGAITEYHTPRKDTP